MHGAYDMKCNAFYNVRRYIILPNEVSKRRHISSIRIISHIESQHDIIEYSIIHMS